MKMEPSTLPSWNLATNNSNYWSNGGYRKRKAAATDLDERMNKKIFVTEEKMVKDMQTLSLDLAALNNTPSPTPQIEEEPVIDEPQTDEEDNNNNNEKEPHIEIHKSLKDSLKTDDLQDSLISKLCEIERRKLTMQIVPYMPIHPVQLNNDKPKDEEKRIENQISSSSSSSDESKNENDDYHFKIPSIPTAYTVEEPSDSAIKRGPTMKRSYSQSNQYNSNLSVTELKSDANDYSTSHQSQSAYFITEPHGITRTTSNTSGSSLSSGEPSVRITEFIENSTSNNEFTSTLDDDDVDMQSIASSDTGDKMDDD